MAKKKYPRPDKLQIYPGIETYNKLAKMAEQQQRKVSQMASIIIYKSVKDIEL